MINLISLYSLYIAVSIPVLKIGSLHYIVYAQNNVRKIYRNKYIVLKKWFVLITHTTPHLNLNIHLYTAIKFKITIMQVERCQHNIQQDMQNNNHNHSEQTINYKRSVILKL